ncbi:MAG: TnsA endonuclease N-terminal domain-containing protein [Candidatus Thiodiazotropha endolucinida]
MRTTKRFTPQLLDRYRALGRGTGKYESYIPWHRVSRSDPSSLGRSCLVNWRGRHIELLSDNEFIAFCFSTRIIEGKNDLREQFPLALESYKHELSLYHAKYSIKQYPGTLEIADQLQIKHPKVYGDGLSANWVMTTDILLTLGTTNNSYVLLAISVKNERPLSKRAKALLLIEKTYWQHRDVPWLLITPRQYHLLTAETLQRTYQWALKQPVSMACLDNAKTIIYRYQGSSYEYILKQLARHLGNNDLSHHALWQSVWSGFAPVDLRRGWRPHLPLQLLGQDEFDALNPVLARRSAWT